MSALYRQVCDELLLEISSGQRNVGDRLPPEAEFANEVGVSRSTIRLAFKELESIGVLRRRKRAGTVIIASTPQPKFSMATSGINDLLSIGNDTAFHIDNIATVHVDDVETLQGHHSETDYWLEVSGSRTMNNEKRPFGTNQVYIPARFSGIEPVLEKTNLSVFQAIERAFNVTVNRVTQSTTAIPCPEREAGIMGIKVGESVLKIDAALYVEDNLLMELSVALFDPTRFRLFSDVVIA
ncbi:MAG: GntR family transcriptional regulator [Granulosicoccus sp.]